MFDCGQLIYYYYYYYYYHYHYHYYYYYRGSEGEAPLCSGR